MQNMKNIYGIFLICLIFTIISTISLIIQITAIQLPLQTKDDNIIDSNGRFIHLHAINWVSHLETMIPEGLLTNSIKDIVSILKKTGFNTVRLTYALDLISKGDTKLYYAINDDILYDLIIKSNPNIANYSIFEIYDTVISELTTNDMMIILDNHVSKASWCCNNNDGNSWIGDTYFNNDTWINSLYFMGSKYSSNKNVIGFGLRNEPRGDLLTEENWKYYMNKAANTIHSINQDKLVFIGGMDYSTNFSFFNDKMFTTKHNKVLEMHWYEWTSNIEDCLEMQRRMYINTTLPIFYGEFGINQEKRTESTEKYLNCMLDKIKEQSWGLWNMNGEYYKNKDKIRQIEEYSIYDIYWSIKNETFLKIIFDNYR